MDRLKLDDTKPLVLDVGSGPEEGSMGLVNFPDATVIRLDADPDLKPDYVHDITEPLPVELHDKFDMLFMSHVLEHIPYGKVTKVLRNLRQALKPNTGEFWIVVPALEWAAREIAKDRPSPVLMSFIYGSQANEYQYHKSGYTLNQLRFLMEGCGLVTRRAFQTPFKIMFGLNTDNPTEHQATQNVCVGLRSD